MVEAKIKNIGAVETDMAESYEYSDTFRKKASIFWRRFKKHKLAVFGLVVLVVLYLAAFLAPVLSPYDPNGTIDDTLFIDKAPTFHAWQAQDMDGNMKIFAPNYFGRDELGRDVFSRCLYAGRISLTVGFVAVAIFVFLGVVWGAISGYYGGIVDNIMMRIVDAINCIPVMMLLITIMALFKPNLIYVMIVIGLTGWTGIARYVRAEFLSLRKRDFVEAARCIGNRNSSIIFGHILPNTLAPVIVSATMGLAGAILTESSLSFFGLGIQPPTATWGNMLMNAQELNTMLTAPWKAVYPGLLIFLTVLSFNFVGDGLRDALDPKLKQ